MSLTRRTLLQSVGTAAAGPGGIAAATETATAGGTYRRIPVDTHTTLFDVVGTREGPFAVGLEGTLVRRGKDRYQLVSDGYPFEGHTHLYGLDVTGDGRRLWIVGDECTVAEYDVETGEIRRHDIGIDDRALVDIGVTGPAGEGTVYIIDGRGNVFYTFDYGGTWEQYDLGHGTPTVALDRFGERGGVVLDIDGCVFRTLDGTTWEQFETEGLDRYMFDIAGQREYGTIVGESGLLISGDETERHWHVLGDVDLLGVDYRTTDMFGVTTGFGGTVFEFHEDWRRVELPVEFPLFGVYVGEHTVIVGADGGIFERR